MSLLGKGTYGCVYKTPGLPCETNKSINLKYPGQTLVTKMVVRSQMQPEVDAAQRLSILDPNQIYTVYALLDTICTPTKAQLETCPIVYEYTHDPNQAAMYHLRAGNVTYSYFLKQPQSKYPQMAIVFIQHAIHLFEALSVLHTNKFYHLDINASNLILGTFSDSTLKPRFIDFGISFDAMKYSTYQDAETRILKYIPYTFAPPESQILMDSGNTFLYERWLKTAVEGQPMPERFIQTFSQWYKMNVKEYGKEIVAPWQYFYQPDFAYSVDFMFNKLPEAREDKNVVYLHDMFQHMDVYMLSAVFIRAIKPIKDQFEFSKKFWDVLGRGVDPNYIFRPSAADMVDLLKRIRFPAADIQLLDQVPETPDLPFLTTVRGSQFQGG